VQECPEGALARDDSGVIRLDRELCNGCDICKEVCPAGGVFFAPDGYPLICDLCGKNGSPRCVAICPSDALDWQCIPCGQKRRAVPPEEIAKKVRKKVWGKAEK